MVFQGAGAGLVVHALPSVSAIHFPPRAEGAEMILTTVEQDREFVIEQGRAPESVFAVLAA